MQEFLSVQREMHMQSHIGINRGKQFYSPLFPVCLSHLPQCVLSSIGGLGADPVECVSSAGHHQPGAECHDPAHCWQPCSQLSGTAAPQQEPQSPGNTVAMQPFSFPTVVLSKISMQWYLDHLFWSVCSQVRKETGSDQGRSGERDSGSCFKERQCSYTPSVPRLGPCAVPVCSLSW